MASPATFRIVPFQPELAGAFDQLNRAWLVAGNFLEPLDELYLGDPDGQIMAKGGQIFFALEGSEVLGTAAAIPQGQGAIELAKLAVAPAAQGRGLGRSLTLTVIAFARAQGADRVILTSNSRLRPALALYRSLGFVERPCPPGFGYETADVYMELALVPAAG
jgi:ribosomal protein S18 acetylase RimI-like enzyme